MSTYPPEFLALLESVTAQRPRTIIQHILEHGYITSEDIMTRYEYDHPPRAARDVRERGIPLVTTMIKSSSGKRIAVYTFGDPKEARRPKAKSAGRTSLSRALKKALLNTYGPRCFVYLEEMDASKLQIDHRIPYEIGGEYIDDNVEHYMLLSPSANRTKSWTCEHCENWEKKDRSFCITCFWASPENYTHVAGKPEKVVALIFTADEIEDYYKLIELSGEATAQETIKKILHEHLN